MCKRNTFALNEACANVHVNISDGSEERLEEAGGHRDDVRGVEAQKGDELEADKGFRVLFWGASEGVRGVSVQLVQGDLLRGSMQKIGFFLGVGVSQSRKHQRMQIGAQTLSPLPREMTVTERQPVLFKM